MKKLIRNLLILLFFLTAANAWVATLGQEWVRSWVNSEEVRVGRVSGFFPFFVVAEDVVVGDEIEIDSVTAWWLPTQLFWNEIHLSRVHAHHVRVNSPTSKNQAAPSFPAEEDSSRLTLSLQHLEVDRLEVAHSGYHLDSSAVGRLRYSFRGGEVSGKIRLLGKHEGAVSKLSFHHISSGKHPRTHFVLSESSEGPLSSCFSLPSHPAFTLSGDLLVDKLTDQLRADVEISTLADEPFPLLEQLPFSLGSTLHGKGTVVLEPYGSIHVHSVSVQTENLDLEGEVIITSDGTVESSRVTSQLHTPTGSLQAIGSLHGSLRHPEWDLKVASQNILLFDRPLTKLQGRLKTVGDFSQGELNLTASLYGRLVELSSGYILDGRESIHLTKMQAKTERGRIDGQLRLFLANRLAVGSLKGHFDDLSTLAGLLHVDVSGSAGGEVVLTAKPINGSKLPGQSISINAAANHVYINGLRARKGAIDASLDDLYGTPEGTVSLSLENGDYQHWEDQTVAAHITLKKDRSHFHVMAKNPSKNGNDLEADGYWMGHTVTLSELSGHFMGSQVNLETPLVLVNSDDELLVSSLDLTVGKGGIVGNVLFREDQSAIDLEMLDLPLELLEFLSPELPAHGRATGRIHLKGDPHAPEGTLSLELVEGRINDTKPFTGSVAVELVDGRMVIEATSPDSALTVDIAATPSLIRRDLLFDTEAPVSAKLLGRGNATSYLQLFVDDISRLDGLLDLDLALSGTLSAPELHGTIFLKDGVYESLYTGALFQKINGKLVAEGDRVVLSHLTAQDHAKGTLSAEGEVELSLQNAFPYHMDISLDRVQLLGMDHAKAKASGKLTIAGDGGSGVVAGNMTIDSADIEIPDKIPSALYVLDVTYINSPPFHQPMTTISAGAAEDPYPVSLDVHFEVPKTATLKGRGLNTEWKGAIDVRGTTAQPTLHGKLSVARGDFMFAGRQLLITSGSAVVDGPPNTTTYLDVESTSSLGETLVTVSLRGPVKDLDLAVTSQPNLPLKEVLSRLLFDKEFDEINRWQGLQLAQAVVHVTGGSFAPDILGKLQRGFGLDRLEITGVDGEAQVLEDDELEERRTEGQLSFQVGKYLTRGFFVGLSKNVETDANSVAIEADITNSLKLKGEWGDDSAGKMSLTWRRDY